MRPTHAEAWDDEGRLTGWTGGGKNDTFLYNGLGLRLDKEDSTGSHVYIADGVSPGSDILYDLSGFVFFTPGLSENDNGTSKYYHADALGSTRGITDTGQNPTDGLLYDAFGELVSRTGTTQTEAQYGGTSGYRTDADSKLMLLGHRYYNPATGRFLSQDPSGSGDNWYAYADNDPIDNADPSGLWPQGIDGVYLGGIGFRNAGAPGSPNNMGDGYWQRDYWTTRNNIFQGTWDLTGHYIIYYHYYDTWVSTGGNSGPGGEDGRGWVGDGEIHRAYEPTGGDPANLGSAFGDGADSAADLLTSAASIAVFGGFSGIGVAGEGAEALAGGDDTISLFHGSTNDFSKITELGLSVEKEGATYVSTDINAAKDAIGASRVDQMLDPGIIESNVSRSDFESLVQSGDIGIRPYTGFYPYNLNSVEYQLFSSDAKSLFNSGIVR